MGKIGETTEGRVSRMDADRLSPRRLSDYLDVLDTEGVPVSRRVLSALAPRMLRIAAERSAGTHPYLTFPDHTAWAREQLGPDVIVAPEVTMVDDADPMSARATGREMLVRYLGMQNYTRTMTAWGFDEKDIEGSGSERLVDTLMVWGSPDDLADAMRAHLDAGASHVCLQILPVKSDPTAKLHRLGAALGLDSPAESPASYRRRTRVRGRMDDLPATDSLDVAVARAYCYVSGHR